MYSGCVFNAKSKKTRSFDRVLNCGRKAGVPENTMFQEPRPRSEFRSTRSQTKSVRGTRLVEGDGLPVLGAGEPLRVGLGLDDLSGSADLGEVEALRTQTQVDRQSGVATDRTNRFARKHESPHPRWCECGPLPQT